jgi:transcription elongation GreA/GreB family factor
LTVAITDNMNSSVKVSLYQHCLEYVNNCVDNAQLAINDAMQSGNTETKSSAGDKHETGRALLQLEQEKNTKQLYESIALKEKLVRIDPLLTSDTVTLGSVVITSNGNFYIAVAAGKVKIDGTFYVSISPSSPVAMKLMGLRVGHCAVFNEQPYEIQSVL